MNKQEYKEFLESDYWKCFRKEVYEIFNNECWFCKSDTNLNLHHTNYYKRTFYSKRKAKNNLRWFLLLCRQCHYKIHSIQKKYKLNVYKATKKFRDDYYPKKKMWLSKKSVRTSNHRERMTEKSMS